MTPPKALLITLTIAVMLGLNYPGTAAEKTWPPEEGVPVTTWGKTITSTSQVWPEYPRPQLVRERWMNLNGPWNCAIVAEEAAAPTTYPDTILVPFPPQSVLSQLGKPVHEHERIWYHRSFLCPAEWHGQRLLLHFGAINWQTTVLVNGTVVGTHTGGYDGFDVDITDAVHPTGMQDLVVSSWNPIEGGQPRGKQALKPSGIFYTPTTGIWQTVWLEPVSPDHITSLRMVPDIAASVLHLTVEAHATAGAHLRAVISLAGKEVATASGTPGTPLAIHIPDVQLWWPTAPILYDVQVTLTSSTAVDDSVTSYAGMRTITLGPDAQGRTTLLLNNRPVFQLGLLDQGFWPDGIYTAPSDEALRFDLEAAKKLGCNMLRKHIKVEPDRWYYWADKLGILVWQDMPSCSEMGFRKARKGQLPDCDSIFEDELRRMIRGRFNHPSIVVWVPFNEGWGLTEAQKTQKGEKDSMDAVTPKREARMVLAIREEDPTRLIDAESGAGGGGNQGANFWDAGLGDIVDFHCYGGDAPKPEAHRASAIGETGWGLALTASLAGRLKTSPTLGESAIVITQLTDVENETNGALRYDRSVKSPLETQGKAIIEMMHQAGYSDYPGGATPAAH